MRFGNNSIIVYLSTCQLLPGGDPWKFHQKINFQCCDRTDSNFIHHQFFVIQHILCTNWNHCPVSQCSSAKSQEQTTNQRRAKYKSKDYNQDNIHYLHAFLISLNRFVFTLHYGCDDVQQKNRRKKEHKLKHIFG